MDIEKKLSEACISVLVEDRVFRITKLAQKNYCRSYDIPDFNSLCIDHIKDQLKNKKYYEDDRQIRTEQLVFTKLKGYIKSIRFNTGIREYECRGKA